MMRFFCWSDQTCSHISVECCYEIWRVEHRVCFLFIFYLSVTMLKRNVLIFTQTQKLHLGRRSRFSTGSGPTVTRAAAPGVTFKLPIFNKVFGAVDSQQHLLRCSEKELECPGSDDCFSLDSPWGKKYEPTLQPEGVVWTWKFSPKVPDKFHPSLDSAAKLIITM